MLYHSPYPTWAGRHAEVRAALAGEPVVTPMELFIYMGGDPDDATPRVLSEAARDLRAHGYRREQIAVRPYGPLEERWVRREHWPEDDNWPA